MPPESVQLRREDLYEQVWAEPMLRLAQRYGISGVALAKICRKMDVPVPPRGYWARKEFGNAPPRPALPAPREGLRESVTIAKRPLKAVETSPEAATHTTAMDGAENRITVPERLVNPHSLVRMAADAFRQGKVDGYGVLRAPRQIGCLAIRVSTDSVPRALRIMDALVKALEARGCPVRVADDPKQGTYVEIAGEKIRFRLEEAIERRKHAPTPAEMERQKKRSWERPPEWDYVPTGRLRLQVDEYTRGPRKLWAGGTQYRLKDMLNAVLKGLVLVAEAEGNHRLEVERWQREWREAEARRQEEEARRQELQRQVQQWAKSQQVRAYLDAVELAVIERGVSITPGSDLHRWLGWARQYADRLDPLKAGPSPSTPEEEAR